MRPNIVGQNMSLAPIEEVCLSSSLSFDRFEEILDKQQFRRWKDQTRQLVEKINEIPMPVENKESRRTLFHVNSTAVGGGVSEMLRFLVPYFNDVGVRTRWLVIKGDEEFFRITKRIHNGLHGFISDGATLYGSEHAHYESISAQNLTGILAVVKPGDICVLHDPQTAGLIHGLKSAGVKCVWRCHIGNESQNTHISTLSWNFLKKYILEADAYVFTTLSMAPHWIDYSKIVSIHPSIDPQAPKNQYISPTICKRILFETGIIDQKQEDSTNLANPTFTRTDKSQGIVQTPADSIRSGPLPDLSSPIVLQISRWDHLKDMGGVMRAFVEYVLPHCPDSTLILAGPEVSSVSDDPEGAEVFLSVVRLWRELLHFERAKVQIVTLPMCDVEENAVIVNALQRCATVICQKSLNEGFGLTVTEAMWKGKAVVASGIGGIKLQIHHGQDGMLIENPTDLEAFGATIVTLLKDINLRQKLEMNAKEKVKREYLPTRHVVQYLELILGILQQ